MEKCQLKHLTGINFFSGELVAKRLDLLHDLLPRAVRVVVLVNPANAPTAEATLRDIPGAARALGLQIQFLNASTSREITISELAGWPMPAPRVEDTNVSAGYAALPL